MASAFEVRPNARSGQDGRKAAVIGREEPIKHWSLTTLKDKQIKIGAKVVGHARYVAFQMAEVAISRNLFADILPLIRGIAAAADGVNCAGALRVMGLSRSTGEMLLDN
jgi:hypothetical protein